MEGTEHMEGMIPLEPLPQLQQWHATLNDLIQVFMFYHTYKYCTLIWPIFAPLPESL